MLMRVQCICPCSGIRTILRILLDHPHTYKAVSTLFTHSFHILTIRTESYGSPVSSKSSSELEQQSSISLEAITAPQSSFSSSPSST